MNTPPYPTPWQRKTIWTALTSLAVVTIGAIAVGLVWLGLDVLSFLQPILIPFAVAGVMAYLLEPVVSKLDQWKIPRTVSVLSVFAMATALLLWGAIWLIPVISHQTVKLYSKSGQYTVAAWNHVNEFAKNFRNRTGFNVLPDLADATEEDAKAAGALLAGASLAPSPTPAPSTPPGSHAADASKSTAPKTATALEEIIDVQQFLRGDWLKNALLAAVNQIVRIFRSSVGGFLSVFGFLISLVIIPVYLFYFLIDARTISASWQDYLPLKNSEFKNELVSALTEINGYVIAFFRGQLLVSLINGGLTAVGLMIVGLDFGILIGLVLCFLGLIPYLGILLCWIPAVIIASVQQGNTWIPDQPGWLFPVVVTGIFVLVQKIDSFYITPKVVEQRVGLHPLTVIVSLFSWSFLIGGLLGTILAVPLTATLKVLLRRYAWERWERLGPNVLSGAADNASKARPDNPSIPV
jgi:predicted PurR-regulated permease PerM